VQLLVVSLHLIPIEIVSISCMIGTPVFLEQADNLAYVSPDTDMLPRVDRLCGDRCITAPHRGHGADGAASPRVLTLMRP